MTEPTFEPERIVAALNAATRLLIVGGIAVAAHGVVRATGDVDLVPEPSAENLDGLARVLSDLGAEHPVDEVLTGASLAADLLQVRTVTVKFRYSTGCPSTSFARLRENAIVVDLAPEARAVVCSLVDLRSMKQASGRPRDLVDVAELDELNGH